MHFYKIFGSVTVSDGKDEVIMKITMYGAPICPDCVIAKEELMKRNDVELDYRNITETLSLIHI